MRHQARKFLLVTAAVLLVAGLAAYAVLPRIQRLLVCRSVAWEESPAAFDVLEVRPADDDLPAVLIHCRWADGTVPAARFHLTFPESRVSGPYGKVRFARTSSLGGHDFVIQVPLEEKPRLLSAIRLPTRCFDREKLRELGDETLALRYWPLTPEPAQAAAR